MGNTNAKLQIPSVIGFIPGLARQPLEDGFSRWFGVLVMALPTKDNFNLEKLLPESVFPCSLTGS
jgi:hypothetical protein